MDILFDGRCFKTKEAAHAYMKKKLNTDAYVGNNLDALFDVLSTLPEARLTVKYPRSIERRLGDYGDRLIKVLERAALENPGLTLVLQQTRRLSIPLRGASNANLEKV